MKIINLLNFIKHLKINGPIFPGNADYNVSSPSEVLDKDFKRSWNVPCKCKVGFCWIEMLVLIVFL
jgi:hypothetical protein